MECVTVGNNLIFLGPNVSYWKTEGWYPKAVRSVCIYWRFRMALPKLVSHPFEVAVPASQYEEVAVPSEDSLHTAHPEETHNHSASVPTVFIMPFPTLAY